MTMLWQQSGFYIGRPGDKKMLDKEQLHEAVVKAVYHPYQNVQVIIPGYFMETLPYVFNKLGIDPATKRYCSLTGTPSYLLNCKKIVFAGDHDWSAEIIRVESDGKIFNGCNHYIDPENHKALGDLETIFV